MPWGWNWRDPDRDVGVPAEVGVDLDGVAEDGEQDLAIGAPGESSNNGAVRIVSGPITGSVDLGDGDVMGLIGYAGDRAGSVLVADDFDGDLITDLLVGSPGQDSISNRFPTSLSPENTYRFCERK